MLEKLTGGRYTFGTLRTFTDCFCLVFGVLIGCITGKQFELANVGTVLLALFTGALIVFWRKLLRKKDHDTAVQ